MERVPRVWTWSAGPRLPRGQRMHTATSLQTGDVLMAGGVESETEIQPDDTTAAHVYDWRASAWRSTGEMMARQRWAHVAARLPNGDVLVAGGREARPDGGCQSDPRYACERSLASAEIYDVTTNSWRTAAPMANARGYAASVVLMDGRVLVVGGTDEVGSYADIESMRGLASAEIYDPDSGRWELTPPLAAPLVLGSAVLLASGDVLVAGYAPPWSENIDNGHWLIYKPEDNVWTTPVPLVMWMDAGSSLTLMANGQVLFACGNFFRRRGAGLLSGVSRVFDPTTLSWRHTPHDRDIVDQAVLLDDGSVLVGSVIPLRYFEILPTPTPTPTATETVTSKAASPWSLACTALLHSLPTGCRHSDGVQ
jgi:hypothetical protein